MSYLEIVLGNGLKVGLREAAQLTNVLDIIVRSCGFLFNLDA